MQNPSSAAPVAYTNCLRVNRIRLDVKLGYEKEERIQRQPVEIDLAFFFQAITPPSLNDDGDFICYDKVSHALKAMCEGREFRLIEYLALELHKKVRSFTPDDVKLSLRLTKCEPPIAFVLGGTSFTYTDLPPFAWTPPL